MELTSPQTHPHPQHPPHTFANGTLKKLHSPLPQPTIYSDVEYLECLKNHAASLGGHALDGCGEFTPNPSSSPSIPTSLTCAACGCHRNFHRRRPRPRPPSPPSPNPSDPAPDPSASSEDPPDPPNFPPTPPSAPHILLALGGPGAPRSAPAAAPGGALVGSEQQKRRARTKFTPEQKGRMQELAERLGWRMPKRDVEGLVEGVCRRIGVERSVFKVWMHNNKLSVTGSATSAVKGEAEGHGLGVGGGGDGGGVVQGVVHGFVVNVAPPPVNPNVNANAEGAHGVMMK